jgi:hypothetical protein
MPHFCQPTRPKGFDEQGWVVLPESVAKTFGKIEIVIEDKKKSRLLYIQATRERCQIEFRWNKIMGGIAAVVTLLVGLKRFWS